MEEAGVKITKEEMTGQMTRVNLIKIKTRVIIKETTIRKIKKEKSRREKKAMTAI
jgi:hypothetical protein